MGKHPCLPVLLLQQQQQQSGVGLDISGLKITPAVIYKTALLPFPAKLGYGVPGTFPSEVRVSCCQSGMMVRAHTTTGDQLAGIENTR